MSTLEILDEPPRNFVQRLQDYLARSRFFTFSLLLHVVIFAFAATVVIFRHSADAPDFAPEGGNGLVADETSAEPPPTQEEVQQQVFTPSQPTVSAPSVDVIVSNTAAPAAFVMQAAMPSIKAPAPDMSQQLNKAATSSLSKGMSNLPDTMKGRAGGMARTQLMQKNKMMEASEKAVLAGLKWLKEHQKEDGSWGERYHTAMTGLAVLCFLGHGETPEAPEFGPTVKKGVDWLLKKGIAAQGALAGKSGGFGQTDVYEHAIGTYALGEYYTMTKDDRVKDVLTQAVTYIVQGQNTDGGWLYGYKQGEASDTSVSGWQIQALKAAHLTGLAIPGVDEALDKSMLNLKRVQKADGSFGYHTPEQGKYSLTGVGVLCTYFWKGQRDKTVEDGVKYILDKTEKDNPVEYKGARADLYAWYYHTQACLMVGGLAWQKWNKWFQKEITDNQSKDGSWPPTGNPKPVGGLESGQDINGQVYRTGMSVLMLEVFYRYMPTSKS